MEAANGEIKEKTLTQLHKMDSFIRESQRLNPLTLLSSTRYIVSDVTLSNGQTIPGGSSVALPLYAMNRDPNIFENPEVFDGERFLKLRATRERGEEYRGEKSAPKWGLLDIHAEANVNFGHGKHVCPGRLLAINEARFPLSSPSRLLDSGP